MQPFREVNMNRKKDKHTVTDMGGNTLLAWSWARVLPLCTWAQRSKIPCKKTKKYITRTIKQNRTIVDRNAEALENTLINGLVPNPIQPYWHTSQFKHLDSLKNGFARSLLNMSKRSCVWLVVTFAPSMVYKWTLRLDRHMGVTSKWDIHELGDWIYYQRK